MSQEWKAERECLRYGGQWRDGRCVKRGQHQSPERQASAATVPHQTIPAQESVDAAAEASREAWLLSGKLVAYLLAEARPTLRSHRRPPS